jgi:hypothetical protein
MSRPGLSLYLSRMLLAALVCAAGLNASLRAQIVAIPPSQCVVRSGDSPAWAAPALDEAGWKPFAHWTVDPGDAHIWIRCHADLGSLRGVPHPAILAGIPAANEVYFGGKLIGGAGSLSSGYYSMNTMRTYALPELPPAGQPATIALRITLRDYYSTFPADITLTAGSQPTLLLARDSAILRAILERGAVTLCWVSIGAIGLLLLGLFATDRTRREALWLGLICTGILLLRINTLMENMQVDYPNTADRLIWCMGNATFPTEIVFFFAISGRRMMRAYKVFIAIPFLDVILEALLLPLPAGQSLRFETIQRAPGPALIAILAAYVAACTAPIAAFWPLTRIPARLRTIALFCLLWGTGDMVWFTTELANSLHIGLAFSAGWFVTLLEVRAFIWAGTIVALLVLIVRNQRKVAAERAALAGEMEAAREVQQRLVPVALPAIPGVHLEAVYLPAAEVGGDFYHVIEQPGGATLVVVGDVSGKGLKAAMTGALAMGALGTLAAENLPPGELLTRLNRQMVQAEQEGFITCLCIRVEAGGAARIANAGHLAPYRNGEEIAVDNGFPLGILPGAAYAETTLTLQPGDRLTLLSDGVVEATDAHRQLFGFDRTRALSAEPAAKIASAAQSFGQQDDITVLTIAFVS